MLENDPATSSQERRPWFRFSILALLLLAVLVAVSVVGTQRYLEFRDSRPLETAIKQFSTVNRARYNERVGDGNDPLTPEQVIAFLESNDTIVTGAPARYREVFRRIIKTRRVPNNADFDFIGWRSGPGWLIGLEISEEGGGYRMNIRKILEDESSNRNPK